MPAPYGDDGDGTGEVLRGRILRVAGRAIPVAFRTAWHRREEVSDAADPARFQDRLERFVLCRQDRQ